MNIYYELLKKPVFTLEDVKQYYANAETARSAIKKLLKQEIVHSNTEKYVYMY